MNTPAVGHHGEPVTRSPSRTWAVPFRPAPSLRIGGAPKHRCTPRCDRAGRRESAANGANWLIVAGMEWDRYRDQLFEDDGQLHGAVRIVQLRPAEVHIGLPKRARVDVILGNAAHQEGGHCLLRRHGPCSATVAESAIELQRIRARLLWSPPSPPQRE